MVDLLGELLAVTRVLEEASAEHALVGGLAYSIYVEARATEDIDLLVKGEDWERVRTVLAQASYYELSDPMDFRNVRIRRLTKIENDDAVVLDFILADRESLQDALRDAMVFAVRSGTVRVAPPGAIIELKKERIHEGRSGHRGPRAISRGTGRWLMISAIEVERRLQRCSELRALVLELRRAAAAGYDAGEIQWRPATDHRSDSDYWRGVAAERGIELPT